MAIGEVFIGAFITVLLERLTSRKLLRFLHPAGIDAHLKKWYRTLLTIEAVLNDAENKQTSNRAVKVWLNDLEELAYDLDDLVDKLNTEALHRELKETNETSTSQVSMLRLVMNVRGRRDRTVTRLQLTSVVLESQVHGREKDKEDILNMLLGVESTDSPFSVIPIVGMGGVGKTTLAQLVYNDDRVKEEFDLMAWACVSDEFEAFRVTKIILETVSSQRSDYDDFNMLQVKLKEKLSNKRFLVVLDDVWNESYGDWDILRRPFFSGKPGSKIIVTTRQERVAKIMSQIPGYHLSVLSDDDALSLLAQHALDSKTFDEHPHLREVGTSIVSRSKFVAGDKCLRMDEVLKENLPRNISENVRHFSFIRHQYESYKRFNFVSQIQRLRTFLPLPIERKYFEEFLSKRVLLDLLPNLYCLRVLSLNGFSVYELPDSVGDLRHLRYLDLSETLLKWLPLSVCTLINLQVLILRGCPRLTKLPASMEHLINLYHLDIVNTNNLHEVPQGISQLASLRTLSKMIVSKSSGMRLRDLGNLSLLQGEISILELQNVVNVQEAIDAKLIYKQRLNKIRLTWSNKFGDCRNEILEFEVLNALRPHESLSSLEVECYGGAKFASWIGDSAFLKLEKISFNFCRKCTTLPSLGQLPLLRELSIRGMDQIKVIGADFFGNKDSGELPFPSLDSLTFEDMPDWEEWLGLAHEEEGIIVLPQLSKLYIRRCPKLFKLPILSLPSLCELEARECNEVVLNHMRNLESLTQLKLWRIFGLTSAFKAFVQFPFALKNFEVSDCDDLLTLWPRDNIEQNLISLKQVFVARCPQLLSLQEIGVLPVRSVKIWSCGALELLPNNISCLELLYISNCSSLNMMTTLLDCSTSLEHLTIGSWANLNLTTLLGSVRSYSSLTMLYIDDCNGLESFPHGGLPTPNLKSLLIGDCKHLKSLPNSMELLLSLESLSVRNCPSLIEPFPQGNIPPNLTDLIVGNCGTLKPLGEWNLHKLARLDTFGLFGGYPDLVSFSNDDDDCQRYLLPPSLTFLTLSHLPNLETLSKGFQNLTSLHHLQISDCPKLVSLPMEDQLHNLSRLRIGGDCSLLKKRFMSMNSIRSSRTPGVLSVVMMGHKIMLCLVVDQWRKCRRKQGS
ncbi:unnamed protein product [Fraxinus pennsylvanica]|uniref:Disease resistance RPP13-like protein 1 n=1 Tax=Fraxinus pennsylvanica TaxID=56036 RepID=A0AAD1ZB57_9LAMI|nr:unnamed protein product [Fraxinus pennsylvanica]